MSGTHIGEHGRAVVGSDVAEIVTRQHYALSELLEQIDTLQGVELTRDIEPYKAQACWDDAVKRAQDIVAELKP